jgi:hypothetical protein
LVVAQQAGVELVKGYSKNLVRLFLRRMACSRHRLCAAQLADQVAARDSPAPPAW